MIDTNNWKSFKVSDIFVTEKHGSGLQTPTGAMMSKKDLEDGDTPRVTVSNYNNGITGYYADSDNKNYRTHENFISVSFLGTVFYQPEKVSLDMKVHCLKPLDYELNVYSAGYIVSIIRKAISNFAYSDQLSSTVLAELEFALPATTDGQPDWNYMESYMKAVMEESEKNFENLKRADSAKHLIDVSGWGEFRVGDLFDKLTLKCRKSDFNKAVDCSEIQTEEFSLPLTNAKHFNNGIQFYGRPDEWDSAEMTIDIVSNGAIATGDVYAQPQKTGVLWDSYLVKCKYDIESEFVLQYMACVIQKCIKQYFGWDDKCTWDKVKEQTLQLPIDVNGEPDWQYMKDYMEKRLNEAELAVSQLQLAV